MSAPIQWGRVRIKWLDDRTGETGIYTENLGNCGSVSRDPDSWEFLGWSLFMWLEGNYACDHNRIPFFLDREETEEELDGGCTEHMKIVSMEITPIECEDWQPIPYSEV